MQISLHYDQKVRFYIEEVAMNGRPVLIFGASRGGWYVMKVLEYFGINISAFVDNDPCKQSQYFYYDVYAPEVIADHLPDAIIFLGAFTEDAATAIRDQLESLGFRDIYYATDAFLFVYFTVVAGRNCDKNVFAQSIRILFENYSEGADHYGNNRKNHFVSPFVTSVITQKCSLRCQDCGQRMPYYESPVNYSVGSIINDIKNYARAFDVVPEMSLHGGEPFLHPEIKKICRETAKISNIVFISFITNGTILPSADTMHQLTNCGADIQQSDYGYLSKKQSKIFAICRQHNVYCDILYTNPTKMWTRPAPIRKHNRCDEDNAKIYTKCVSSKICCQIMDGELHRCPISMHGANQGLFPKIDSDFVRLDDCNVPDDELKTKIRLFISRNLALNACDYCDPANGIEVPPAIQLPGKSQN
jgi:organic radical activating enzyme